MKKSTVMVAIVSLVAVVGISIAVAKSVLSSGGPAAVAEKDAITPAANKSKAAPDATVARAAAWQHSTRHAGQAIPVRLFLERGERPDDRHAQGVRPSDAEHRRPSRCGGGQRR